jgi:preprotein translocase subunit SecA
LFGEEPAGGWTPHWPELAAQGRSKRNGTGLALLERAIRLRALDRGWADHLAWVNDTKETIHLVRLGGLTPDREFQKSATENFLAMMTSAEESARAEMEGLLAADDPALESQKIKGPSSTWTYLVKEDQFGWGLELAMGKNIGLAVSAALSLMVHGPLYVFVLALRRLLGRKKAP